LQILLNSAVSRENRAMPRSNPLEEEAHRSLASLLLASPRPRAEAADSGREEPAAVVSVEAAGAGGTRGGGGVELGVAAEAGARLLTILESRSYQANFLAKQFKRCAGRGKRFARFSIFWRRRCMKKRGIEKDNRSTKARPRRVTLLYSYRFPAA